MMTKHVPISAGITRCIIIIITIIMVLGILAAAITASVDTIKSGRGQLEGFPTPAAEAATATAVAGPSSSSSSSSSSSTSLLGKQFEARLTGDNEVPPVDTDATGRIKLTVNSQQNTLDYQLSLSNLNGVVTGAHIHRGTMGTNGPIVASLNIGGGTFAGALASASAGDGGEGSGSATTSTSTGGTITSADLKGPLLGKQVSDLIRLVEDGKAYVNVHTDQKPSGEIRGQLKPSTSSSSPETSKGSIESSSSSTGASATASTFPSASASATAP